MLEMPRTGKALGELGSLHHRAGRLAEAEALYRQALVPPVDESVFDVLTCLGALLIEKGEHAEAKNTFRRARSLAPDARAAAAAAMHAAKASAAAGDVEGAIEELLFVRRQPGGNTPEVRDQLTRLYWDEYHKWFYDSGVWRTMTFMGIPCLKSPADMWSYQEILFARRPSLVVELGTFHGGATCFFSMILRQVSLKSKVLSVDVDHRRVSPLVRSNPHIELMTESSASPRVAARIRELRAEYPGPVFAILDSDHSKNHVLAEMELLRDVLSTGDTMIVEDSDINGHPVRPDFGEGPFEAIAAYIERHPNDYTRDVAREEKFGFTLAPSGFLVRR